MIIRLADDFGLATVDHALLQTLEHADLRLSKRDKRPFSRQELLVLMTALLLDT